MIVRVVRVDGGVTIQMSHTPEPELVSGADPCDVGKLVLDMLDRPQPQVLVEQVIRDTGGDEKKTGAEPEPERPRTASSFDFGSQGGFKNLEGEAMAFLDAKGADIAKEGLGFLRSISRKPKTRRRRRGKVKA